MIEKLLSLLCACIVFVSIASLSQTKNFSSQNIKNGFGVGINFATY